VPGNAPVNEGIVASVGLNVELPEKRLAPKELCDRVAVPVGIAAKPICWLAPPNGPPPAVDTLKGLGAPNPVIWGLRPTPTVLPVLFAGVVPGNMFSPPVEKEGNPVCCGLSGREGVVAGRVGDLDRSRPGRLF